MGTFFVDNQFQDLYPTDELPAFSPWRLALVTVMQFAENLSDRQAADAVHAQIDWKYSLSLLLHDEVSIIPSCASSDSIFYQMIEVSAYSIRC